MYINLKKIPLLSVMIMSLIGHASGSDSPEEKPDQTVARHKALSSSSLTVGCTGNPMYITGPLGDLMRGPEFLRKESADFKKDIEQKLRKNPTGKLSAIELDDFRQGYGSAQQKQSKGIFHDHPGATLDIAPGRKGLKHTHYKSDWLQYRGDSQRYEDIFLEQLPPAGVDGMNSTFMPLALQKAHELLQNKSRLVIQIALDCNINSSLSKEDLEQKRSENPFISVLNKSAIDLLNKYLETHKKSTYPASHPVVQAFSFYEQKITQLLKDSFGEEEGKKQYDALYNPDKLITDMEVLMRNPLNPSESRGREILTDILKLLGLIVQKPHIIKYLNSHGFNDAHIEWLDAGSHSFSPSGGWFVTAFKNTPLPIEGDEPHR